jgi:hypothetical protein
MFIAPEHAGTSIGGYGAAQGVECSEVVGDIVGAMKKFAVEMK